MNILILGGGGREHCFAWKISSSPLCSQLFIAPGNAGTTTLGQNIDIDPMDFNKLEDFVEQNNIDILLVGPEAPLVGGIQNHFISKNVFVIGPSGEAALLEGSKAFAKEFMLERNIPTAAYRVFDIGGLEDGLQYIENLTPPVVLKADGLAAGKGVVILNDIEEAKAEFTAMLSGKFGTASHKVVIEEFLTGIEFSVFVVTDGNSYKLLPVAKDYKRIGEGDTGLNTGGMGAVSPVPFVDEPLMQKVITRIIEPTIEGIKSRKIDYTGFIFFGLINVKGDPYVIEYNCRMGDPETEVVLPRLQNDLVEIFIKMKENSLDDISIKLDSRFATTVMMVSGGYPKAYEKGIVINHLEEIEESIIFHAGTKKVNDRIVTSGGRVLALTSMASKMNEAIEKSMKSAQKIDFQGKYYRRDIGFDL